MTLIESSWQHEGNNFPASSSDVKLLQPPEHPSATVAQAPSFFTPTANGLVKKPQQHTPGRKKAPEAGKGDYGSSLPGQIFTLYVVTCMKEVGQRGGRSSWGACGSQSVCTWPEHCLHVGHLIRKGFQACSIF